jgi:hypothetical protein
MSDIPTGDSGDLPSEPLDIDALIASLADADPHAPREPSAEVLLASGAPGQRSPQLRRKVSRTCPCCERQFKTRNPRQVTCNECRRAGKRSCMRCRQTFDTVRGPMERLCPGCRPKWLHK